MSINPDKRKCSAVRSDGQPCQAWAVIGSDPAMCPAHLGMQRGAGAPKGNRNAMKHGLYVKALQPDDIEDLEIVKSKTLVHELVLARAALRRLAGYLEKPNLDLAEVKTIIPLMSTMIRTVIRLQNHIDYSFDWNEVLDEIKGDWDIEV